MLLFKIVNCVFSCIVDRKRILRVVWVFLFDFFASRKHPI